MNYQLVEFFMWLLLFASILVVFSAILLEFVLKDSTDYDMEHHWKYKFSLKDLHLGESRDE